MFFVVFFVFLFLFFGEAWAEDGVNEKKVDFSGYFQNFFIFKTDSDFDKSPAFYEPWGQTAGVLGTYAEPKISFFIGENKFAIETLWGFNLWSRNFTFARPDAGVGRQLFIFARQIYSDVKIGESRVKVGYQYFADPLEIFLRNWIGGARFESKNFQIFLGQVPEQTYEGIELFSNNFVNDTFVFSIAYASGGFVPKDGIPFVGEGFFGGIYNLIDNSIIRKFSFVSTLILGYRYETDDFSFIGGVAGQSGVFTKSAFDLKNENHLAGALQASITKKGEIKFGSDIMVLSPDNPTYREGQNFGFIYSGKSMSRTLLLTEDEIIFKSDNLDLNIGERFSQFRLMRPGFFVFDVWGEFPLFSHLSFIPIGGVGLTLSGENSLKSNFIGAEIDGVFRYAIADNLRFDFANIFFIPGRAAAAFVNKINPASANLRQFIYSVEFSLRLSF
jgi:hypothetical protein